MWLFNTNDNFLPVLPPVLVPRPHNMDHFAIKSEFKSPGSNLLENQYSPGSQSETNNNFSMSGYTSHYSIKSLANLVPYWSNKSVN